MHDDDVTDRPTCAVAGHAYRAPSKSVRPLLIGTYRSGAVAVFEAGHNPEPRPWAQRRRTGEVWEADC